MPRSVVFFIVVSVIFSDSDGGVAGGVVPYPKLEARRRAEAADGELLGGEDPVPGGDDPELVGRERRRRLILVHGDFVDEGQEAHGDEVGARGAPEIIESFDG